MQGEKDWDKFETARKLKAFVGDIREKYEEDFKSKEMRIRQRAVALYFIDKVYTYITLSKKSLKFPLKLALRAGNEKDIEEAADTVGCCSLRCEHIKFILTSKLPLIF